MSTLSDWRLTSCLCRIGVGTLCKSLCCQQFYGKAWVMLSSDYTVFLCYKTVYYVTLWNFSFMLSCCTVKARNASSLCNETAREGQRTNYQKRTLCSYFTCFWNCQNFDKMSNVGFNVTIHPSMVASQLPSERHGTPWTNTIKIKCNFVTDGRRMPPKMC